MALKIAGLLDDFSLLSIIHVTKRRVWAASMCMYMYVWHD